jgi:hypothetical protein
MRRHYLIDLPAAPYTGVPRLVPVRATSLKAQRCHVERFARYFLREMHMGGMQFEAAEAPSSEGFVEYRAFLIQFQDRFVGGGCFRYRVDQDEVKPWLFDWLWIHPFFRHRQVLTRVWPELRSYVGEFRLAHPLSLHMKNFLTKVGHGAA